MNLSCILKEALRLLKTQDRSSGQISDCPSMKSMHVSHEAICKCIRSGKSVEAPQSLSDKLRCRRHVKAIRKTGIRNIPCRASVYGRPAEAGCRRFGDWKTDFIIGE